MPYLTDIIEIFLKTPIWVYAVLIYLIWRGLSERKNKVIKLKTAIIFPTVLTLYNIYLIYITIAKNAYNDVFLLIICWISTMSIGLLLGKVQVERLKFKVNIKHYALNVSGTWSTLIVLMLIFVGRYYFAYMQIKEPQLSYQLDYSLSLIGLMGLGNGFFLGQLRGYFVKYSKLSQLNVIYKIAR